jgi:uncharacterized protein YndB with AHSA1/START domain
MGSQVATLDELRTWTLERSVPHDQVTVWEALTDGEAMQQWSAREVEGTRSLGAPVTVSSGDGGAPEEGHIIAFERPRLFGYTYGGRTMTWEVMPDEEAEGSSVLRCLVTVDREGPAPATEAEWDRQRAGFAAELDALEELLAGAPMADGHRRRGVMA